MRIVIEKNFRLEFIDSYPVLNREQHSDQSYVTNVPFVSKQTSSEAYKSPENCVICGF